MYLVMIYVRYLFLSKLKSTKFNAVETALTFMIIFVVLNSVSGGFAGGNTTSSRYFSFIFPNMLSFNYRSVLGYLRVNKMYLFFFC